MNTYYLTTPIYYANDVPHIGHAYTTIAADAVARYHRLRGQDVFLLTGTDEHGINIERIAASRSLTPQQHVDAIAASFQDLWAQLDITYDRFVRTTQPAHRRAALALWQRLVSAGDMYRGTYSGAYCSRCEAYYQADELVHERECPIHWLPCEQVSEENWFFRLSRFQAELERLVRCTDFVQPPSRRNEILGVLSQGLRDFSVSRRQVRWGIPVPDAPDEVLYVWVDALANYLTGLGYPDDPATFERFWPADVHIVGKEIIRFHCVYWPALLLSAGLPLPRHVFAHGWLTRDGHKISKTTGNVVDPAALATDFGSDAVRYFFLRVIPFGQDGDFTQQEFVDRYNADLANDFGNLVQRVTTLAQRYSESIPTSRQAEDVGEYVQITAPWALARDAATDRLQVVLEHVVEAARLAAWYYAPIIPRAAVEAHQRLAGGPPAPGGGTFGPRSFPHVDVGPPLFPRRVNAARRPCSG